jgi:hypothetical protein
VLSGNTDVGWKIISTEEDENVYLLILVKFRRGSHFPTVTMKTQHTFYTSSDGSNVNLYMTEGCFMWTLHSKHKHMNPL